ncbi:uncharacterized protein [Eucyclogobius newberryi]|uniref:uncharacterized protein isoform X1 n=1 Tax=Eucyclogobius newberryi TaxID=166745 RepID=UPI003B5CBEA0
MQRFLIIATESERKTVTCDTMEIWLLLTVTGMVSSTSLKITVDEEEKRKYITEGSSVSLHCSVGVNCSNRCRYSWCFDRSGPSKTGCKNDSNKITKSKTTPELHLNNVSQNDSGWYYCSVRDDIPILSTNYSNWTHLVVAPKKPAFVWIDWWMWIAAGVSGLVLIILVIVCLLLRRRQRRQRDSEDPVYANTHHSSKQPSPRPSPTDNSLKMDSSYQNLRTPDVGKRYEPSRRI